MSAALVGPVVDQRFSSHRRLSIQSHRDTMVTSQRELRRATVNTATPITTAARRITREVNATVAETRVWFDAEGHVVDTTPAGMWHTNPADAPVAVLTLRGQRRTPERMTQREAQDLLDAAAAHPGDSAEQGFFLSLLADARERAAR